MRLSSLRTLSSGSSRLERRLQARLRAPRGLIATTAPEILYLKDTDDDGKADFPHVLYTGFRLQNPRHRITNPRQYTANHSDSAKH